jgi:hypothetical protein
MHGYTIFSLTCLLVTAIVTRERSRRILAVVLAVGVLLLEYRGMK